MDVSTGIRTRGGIALLPAILCWSPGASLAVSPDLNAGSDMTPPTVVVASPVSGAAVAGMIAVMARAVDDSAVVGVQFLLNGMKLGAEDTAPPYAVTWDTETGNDGTHTLTAVARDAAGRAGYSAPVSVTVANLPAAPASVLRIEETDAAAVFNGAWVAGNTVYPWSGVSAAYTRGPEARVSFSFNGTRVRWIGWREARGGIARVYLDGAPAGEVDLYAGTIATQVPVFTSPVLSPGVHTLTVEATGDANSAASDSIVVADAFEIETTEPAPPPPGGGITRIEETDASIVWSHDWIADSAYGPWSGGSARYNADAAAYAIFTFHGTGVSWIGYRGRYGGIVKVYIDGALTTRLDTYTPEEEIAVPVYTINGLAAETHSLMIELTGLKNPAALAGETAVDAFDVVP